MAKILLCDNVQMAELVEKLNHEGSEVFILDGMSAQSQRWRDTVVVKLYGEDLWTAVRSLYLHEKGRELVFVCSQERFILERSKQNRLFYATLVLLLFLTTGLGYLVMGLSVGSKILIGEGPFLILSWVSIAWIANTRPAWRKKLYVPENCLRRAF